MSAFPKEVELLSSGNISYPELALFPFCPGPDLSCTLI